MADTKPEATQVTKRKSLKFTAEIKQVTAKKLASLDISYNVLLNTDDSQVLALGALDGETLIKVTVEVIE